MSDNKRKFYSISEENKQVHTILEKFAGQSRNISDFICKAIIEKYNKELNTATTEDMLKTLMGMLGNNSIQLPMLQSQQEIATVVQKYESKAKDENKKFTSGLMDCWDNLHKEE